MDVIIEYASYVIDIAATVLDHQDGLDAEQVSDVEVIHRRAVAFVDDYIQNQSLPVDQLRRYLNHDAMSPISVIIGYSEWLLMGTFNELTGAYKEAIQEIRDYSYMLKEEIQILHEQVWEFMQSIGIPK